MATLEKALKRDKKIRKKKYGQRESGRSVYLIVKIWGDSGNHSNSGSSKKKKKKK